MKKLLLPLLAALVTFAGAKTLQADAVTAQGFGPFAGLNTNSAAEALDAKQSPDLLNVDVGAGGTSIKKRQGYGLDATLSVSTSPVHNLYKFFDSSGNEVRLAFNDFKVNSSINGAAWSVILTTGVTLGSAWDCTDYLGFAYCVSNAFDCPIKTNGTSAGTTGVCGTNAVPQGSVVSNSGDRLLVGATSANPSRIYYSQSTVFTNFTLGVQPSDSSFEDILAPGSKITHLAYRFGRWLWWKDQSFGFLVGTGQFDLQIVTVSNTIGTYDNTDVFDGNYLYFRGSDSQIYTYDGSNLSRAISTDIGPSLGTSSRRKSNQWAQTTQSDFSSGGVSPVLSLSTASVSGSVVTSSLNITESGSASGWSSGSASNVTVGISSISLATNNSGTATNPSFESCTGGGCPGGGGACGTADNWTASGAGRFSDCRAGGFASGCTDPAPQSGSFMAFATEGLAGYAFTFEALDLNSTLLQSASLSNVGGCAWTAATLTPSTANIGRRVKFRIHYSGTTFGNDYLTTNDSYIWGGPISFYYFTSGGLTGTIDVGIDNITLGSSTITTGSFASRAFNMGSPYGFAYASATWTANTSTPSFVLQKSAAGSDPWFDIASSTGVNSSSSLKFLRYLSTFTVTGADNALSSLTGVQIIAQSSGTYYSAWYNAPNLTSWGTLNITSANGDGNQNFFVRSSTSPQIVLNSTVPWVSQGANATVAASTGTYFQLIDSFTVTAATNTAPTLSDFTFNWFEGAASDKMYATYFKNAIWFSMSNGTTSTNNRIFRYDLLSSAWTLYDIASNGFVTYNNDLYFGDPSAGKIYRFGNNVYSDNGTAITAYWKSKPFFGDSPFTEKDLRMGSWYVAYDSGTTLTTTYTLDESTSTVVKTINLYDARKGMIRNNFNFPAGTSPTVFSAKVGDASSNPPWEVFGGVVTFVPRPIVVTP